MNELEEKQRENPVSKVEGSLQPAEELLAVAQLRISALEKSLSGSEAEIADLKASVAALSGKLSESDSALRNTVAGYRNLIIQANADLLPEMVHGDSLAEVDTSVKQAREIVDRVKKNLETEVGRVNYPAGMPERSEFTAGLSARAKIEKGITVSR